MTDKSIPLYLLLNQWECFLFSRKGAGMKLFEAVKEAVTARSAAEYYGIKVGRNVQHLPTKNMKRETSDMTV